MAEGVDGAELLTLHEKGLLPLDGEDSKLDDEQDDEDAPQLVTLSEKTGSMDVDSDEEIEEEEEEGKKRDAGARGSKRPRGEGLDDEDEDEEVDDVVNADIARAGKRARREKEDGDEEEGEGDEEDEEEEEEDGENVKVKFANEVKKADGPGPKVALDAGAATDPRKVRDRGGVNVLVVRVTTI